jgi:transcriptional regulator with XRE-family HTH domain
MVLLRRVIGDALRARRQGQHRTLREVSTAANVSLGYLSEIERGQKEASSELLAAICDALGTQLSDVLRQASDTMALAEQLPDVLVPMTERPAPPAEPDRAGAGAAGAAADLRPVPAGAAKAVRTVTTDGKVSVSVRQDSPLKATLRARPLRDADRDVVCV